MIELKNAKLKKIVFISLILGLLFVSCNKPPTVLLEQEVVFKAITYETEFKSGSSIACENPMAHYALITIQPLLADNATPNGDPIFKSIDVFYLDGNLYSNSLSLPLGNFSVTSFVLMNDNNTLLDTQDDIAVLAVPTAGSDYAEFVSTTLPLNFAVGAFMKNEIPIQVLCVNPANYSNFGFSWFALNPIDVYSFCFYGDLCINDIPGYENTIYGAQNNGDGLGDKIPAIFKIDVFRNNDFLISYNNEDWLGEGSVLCVEYPDYDGLDNYEFILSVKVLVGDQLQYVEYYQWTSTDDGSLLNPNGDLSTITNGVLDFIIGDCDPSADLILDK